MGIPCVEKVLFLCYKVKIKDSLLRVSRRFFSQIDFCLSLQTGNK